MFHESMRTLAKQEEIDMEREKSLNQHLFMLLNYNLMQSARQKCVTEQTGSQPLKSSGCSSSMFVKSLSS